MQKNRLLNVRRERRRNRVRKRVRGNAERPRLQVTRSHKNVSCQIIDDDELWRSILRGLNEEFRHQTVTGAQVQDYVSRRAARDLSRVFTQYLTTTDIPVLEYQLADGALRYRWANVVPGFDMPFRLST